MKVNSNEIYILVCIKLHDIYNNTPCTISSHLFSLN